MSSIEKFKTEHATCQKASNDMASKYSYLLLKIAELTKTFDGNDKKKIDKNQCINTLDNLANDLANTKEESQNFTKMLTNYMDCIMDLYNDKVIDLTEYQFQMTTTMSKIDQLKRNSEIIEKGVKSLRDLAKSL